MNPSKQHPPVTAWDVTDGATEYSHPWDAIDAMIDAGFTIDAIMAAID
jgi:hypothetical protein